MKYAADSFFPKVSNQPGSYLHITHLDIIHMGIVAAFLRHIRLFDLTWTMLRTCPSKQTSTRIPHRQARSPASSGASVLTVPSAQTRTPSRSSATTPICTHRVTLTTTPRSPALRKYKNPHLAFLQSTRTIRKMFFHNFFTLLTVDIFSFVIFNIS